MKPDAGNPASLSPEMLLQAYSCGLFPMALDDGRLGWFSPDPRAVIPIAGFHVPHGLRRALRRGTFEVRWNTAFDEVVRGCADRATTWINDIIFRSYAELHRLGHAHSVECWQDGELAGGLYGVSIGGAFFGESMFSRRTDASKVALYHLVRRLDERGFQLLDTQWITPHLRQFGTCEIPRPEYLRRLTAAIRLHCRLP